MPDELNEITWQSRRRESPIEAVFLSGDRFEMGFRLRDHLARFVEVGASSVTDVLLPNGYMTAAEFKGFVGELVVFAEQLHGD